MHFNLHRRVAHRLAALELRGFLECAGQAKPFTQGRGTHGARSSGRSRFTQRHVLTLQNYYGRSGQCSWTFCCVRSSSRRAEDIRQSLRRSLPCTCQSGLFRKIKKCGGQNAVPHRSSTLSATHTLACADANRNGCTTGALGYRLTVRGQGRRQKAPLLQAFPVDRKPGRRFAL